MTAKIFSKLVLPHLYGKVISNTVSRCLIIYKPSSAVLGLTYRCQCHCVHCSAGSYRYEVSQDLSTTEWMGLLDAIHQLGVPRINLTGGEALLREDIFDIIAYAAKKIVVILESNGLLISDEVALKLKKAKVSCVAVSIDSVDGPGHDSFRGVQGCVDNAIKGIEHLNKARIPFMATYIRAENARVDYIQGFMDLAKKMNVMAVRILPPRPAGNFSCHVDALLSKENETLIRENTDLFMFYFNGMPAPRMCGTFSKATFYISPYGDIQLCPYLSISFGHIKDGSLRSLLEKMWSHAIFQDDGTDCFVLNASFRKRYLDGCVSYPCDDTILMNE